MFSVVSQEQLGELPAIRTSMLFDRGQQFVERHQWSLAQNECGLEIDEYDDTHTTYFIVSSAERHCASVRLRPARAGCMVQKHFPELWDDELKNNFEVTRFCASPMLNQNDRFNCVSDLLLGLCRYCQSDGIGSFFGIVFPPIMRVLNQAGWPAQPLRRLPSWEGVYVLAQWTASDRIAWNIQERRELREEGRARQRKGRAGSLIAA